MIRDSPCDEPNAWGGERRSKQTTSTPRLASLQEVAAPMTPPPMTATRINRVALFRRDSRDRLPWLDGVADLEKKLLDGSGDRGRDLGVDLVGVDLHQGLALGDMLPELLAPGADGDLFGPLQLRHDDLVNLDAHEKSLSRGVLRPSQRRRAGLPPSSRPVPPA